MSSQPPVWFITAASSGFGKYIALEALSRGHKVIASARITSHIADLKENGAVTVTLDVTAPQAGIERVAKEANEQYGYINHLVNAAGYILVGAIEETSPKEDFDQFNTNVFGMLNVSKAFLPYIRATSGHRTISNFGSIGSWRGGAGFGLYVGTKWACSGISESMRSELAPLGISVTVVEPGYFRTGFLNASTRIQSEKQITEYDETAVGQVRVRLSQVDNNQPGDVVKGSKVIVDILTKSGASKGKDIPMRIVLGSDCSTGVRQKIEETVNLLDEWDPITTKTDHK
ncbi:NAD(P)-binding protein [Didymella exigua CBS 183.55]|uniref:NAD(P)-binding protein n=1 Tax=Didymella exigua CBS 183.55 TaxID=1150837 RepID=A0A6A5RHW8_9PLEO|nr:NAD(P)-binding protein [Didymella exigua CBS 183.55]KAF1927392.1 NAD(P)-binding protein [Didymella exigua CBS 183.55]